MRPNVNIAFGNGFLGGQVNSQDGASGIILTGIAIGSTVVLGTIYTLNSLNDALALGINAAYDAANDVVVYKNISDFYTTAPKGTRLDIMVLADTVTMTQMCDKTQAYAKLMSKNSLGVVKTIGITKMAASLAHTTGMDDDVIAAITNAKALVLDEQTYYRYPRFIMEGRDFQGSVSGLQSLRDPGTGPNANRCAVVLANDNDYVTANPYADLMASVGLTLGMVALCSVDQNIGRVKNGALPVVNAGFSNGALNNTIVDADQDALNDKAYIFMRNFAGVAGWFFNDDPTAAPLTDDYCQIANGRVIDKAAAVTYQTFVNEILDDVEGDPVTGVLAQSSASHFEGLIEQALVATMESAGNINAGSSQCVIPAGQTVARTSTLIIELAVGLKGTLRQIDVTLGFGI